ncbi:porin [Massilia sp. H-1]|nr:porin [Massilia sp. H-1]
MTTLNTVVDPLRNGIIRSEQPDVAHRIPGQQLGAVPLACGRRLQRRPDGRGQAEVAGDAQASSAVGGSFGYSKGALNARLAYHRKNNDSAVLKNTEDARNTLLGANYDFGPARGYFGYAINKGLNSSPLTNGAATFGGAAPSTSTDSSDVLLGVAVPFGASTVVGSYVHKNDKTVRNQDAQQFGLAYMFAFSKRTDLYTSYAVIRNRNGAAYTEGNSEEPGTGNKQFTAGLRHRF